MLTEEISYQLLKLLDQYPNLTQRELAEKLSISLGKTNYCINAFVKLGWIKAGNFKRNKNKIGYIYLLTAKGIEAKAQVTLGFLKRKQEEYDALVKELGILRHEASLLKSARDIE